MKYVVYTKDTMTTRIGNFNVNFGTLLFIVHVSMKVTGGPNGYFSIRLLIKPIVLPQQLVIFT